ncbi:MAG: hypothetical protein QOG18_2162 [Microbacteriaceae bacterium]|jgi:hypothetical protein|nr:hypothetical protein [Microbacteriaceae bacterium]
MPVTVAVHDGLNGESCCWTSTMPRASATSSIPLVSSTSRIKIRSECNFCLSESDSVDAIVARIETLKTSSED